MRETLMQTSSLLKDHCRNHFGNAREPFSLTILGMKTYVLTKAEDASDVYRNTQTLSYEVFVQAMMRILGISEQSVQKMFKQLHKDKKGYPNPHGKSLGILFREMHIHQLFPGENLTFLEDRFHKFFDEQLCLERLSEMRYSNQTGPDAVTVPLVQWCSDFFTKAGQDAYFGPKLAELDPSLTDHFIVFDELSYQVIYQYPHFLAKEMVNSKDRLINAFEQYLELPYDQRTDDAWFVKASEEEMRQLGLRAPDIAKAIMTIYWAYVLDFHL